MRVTLASSHSVRPPETRGAPENRVQLRTTLNDIAQLAGCCKSTVSLALRNNPKIPASTRRRVQAAARQLAYRPDPALAFLAAHRWRPCLRTTGTVIAFLTGGAVVPGQAELLSGIRRAAELAGYRVEQFSADAYPNPAHLSEVLRFRSIRGVIVGSLPDAAWAARFPWVQFAAVACDVSAAHLPLTRVASDHAGAVIRAWEEAKILGYERPGLVLFDRDATGPSDRLAAFLNCQHFLPHDDRLPVVRLHPQNFLAFRDWLRACRPDVILGIDDTVHAALRTLGWMTPRDVAFASLARLGPASDETIAGLRHRHALIGETAFEQLNLRLRVHHPELRGSVLKLMVEPVWHPGASLPPEKRRRWRAALTVNRHPLAHPARQSNAIPHLIEK